MDSMWLFKQLKSKKQISQCIYEQVKPIEPWLQPNEQRENPNEQKQ